MSLPHRVDAARLRALSALFAAAMLSACGGGGGGGADAPVASPPPTGTGGVGIVEAPALRSGDPEAFQFKPRAEQTDVAVLEADTGGALYSAWNPDGPGRVRGQGLKLLFFGTGSGCSSTARDGQVASLTGDPASEKIRQMGWSTPPQARLWTPTGAHADCDPSLQDRTGDAAAAILGDGVRRLVLRTSSGVGRESVPSFFGAFPGTGMDGEGTNAHITGTFANFRQAWPADDPLQPWLGGGTARLQATQQVKRLTLPDDASPGTLAQVKQQLMATFVNADCWETAAERGHPCQVQYVFHTTIARSDGGAFADTARLWFDRAQGSMLIVNGLIPGAGGVAVERETGQALYGSLGAATRHQPFQDTVFDVTVNFEQLKAALRIGTARRLGVDLATLTDAQVAEVWGPTWDRRASWALHTAHAAQEIYNDTDGRTAEIVGSWRNLYVGPL
jgi:hypothetical protein